MLSLAWFVFTVGSLLLLSLLGMIIFYWFTKILDDDERWVTTISLIVVIYMTSGLYLAFNKFKAPENPRLEEYFQAKKVEK